MMSAKAPVVASAGATVTANGGRSTAITEAHVSSDTIDESDGTHFPYTGRYVTFTFLNLLLVNAPAPRRTADGELFERGGSHAIAIETVGLLFEKFTSGDPREWMEDAPAI